MAGGVFFGSPRSLLLQPGAYSQVIGQNAFQEAFSWNVVCCMGAALGGEPMTPYLFNDYRQAQELFGAGTPLAEAIRFSFMGGANGGAALVMGVRLDNCAQAEGALTDSNTGTTLRAVMNDFGAYGNTYALSFYPGSTQGIMAVITGREKNGRGYSQRFDNYSSLSDLVARINAESPMTVQITEGGAFATQTLTLATSQEDGRATLTNGQGELVSNEAYVYQFPSTMQSNTSDSMLVAWSASTSFAIDSVDANADTFTTTIAHSFVPGNLLRINGDTLPPGLSDGDQVIASEAPTTTTLKVRALVPEQAFPIASVNETADLFNAPGNDLVNGDVVKLRGGSLDGITSDRHYFITGKSGDNFQVEAVLGGGAIAFSGTASNMQVIKVAGSTDFDITGSITNASLHLLLGRAVISASVPDEFNGAFQEERNIPGYTQTLTNASITASAYSSDSARWTLPIGQTWGELEHKGRPGAIFTIASGLYSGTYQILHDEWDGLSADRTRIVRKLTGDRKIQEGSFTGDIVFYSAALFPRLQPATAALESHLPANGILATGGQYLSVVVGDKGTYYATQIGDNIESVADVIAKQINDDPEFEAAATSTYNPTTYTATITLTAETPGIAANQLPVQFLVNAQDTLLVTSGGDRLSGGVDPLPPRNADGVISGTLTLSNGFDSVPTYQRWLEGLETIKYMPLRWIVPAGTDNIGVQIAIADHCTLMSSTPKRRERLGVLGHGAGWTEDEIAARSSSFQSERVIFVSPSKDGAFDMPDQTTGLLRTYNGYYAAAMVAGMLAAEGNGISDPITHTFLRNVILRRPYESGSVQLDRLIDAGVLTFERDPSIVRSSRGYRVTRAITTWRVTGQAAYKTNAFESISVVNQSDFIAADIRDLEENLFVGQAIFPDTREQVREAVNQRLRRRTAEQIIYGYDPAFTQVTVNPDNPNALDVAYRIAPAPALEFVLNTQTLVPVTAIAA